jgi:hypothetical protein
MIGERAAEIGKHRDSLLARAYGRIRKYWGCGLHIEQYLFDDCKNIGWIARDRLHTLEPRYHD